MSAKGFSPSKNWRGRGYRRPGNKGDYARRAVKNRFGLTRKESLIAPIAQIVRLTDMSAIRVLLGIGRKAKRGETWLVPDLQLEFDWKDYQAKMRRRKNRVYNVLRKAV